MKLLTIPLLISISLNSAAFYESEVTFESPQNYCFHATTINKDIENAYIKHSMIANTENDIKGIAFIVFQKPSEPNSLYIMDNNKSWIKYIPGESLIPNNVGHALQPIMDFTISNFYDLTEYKNNGRIYAGYGIEPYNGANSTDIFQEMIDNNRYRYLVEFKDGTMEEKEGGTICIELSKAIEEYGVKLAQ